MSFDVAVVGAGLAGSLSASMLGRDGHSVVLIDPHEACPPDFRCEKMEEGHVEVLRRTGLADTLLGMATHTDRLWVARFGRLLDIQPFDQYGFRYEDMVNAFRDAIPGGVTRLRGKVGGIEAGEGKRRVVLRDGRSIEARLIILANGLNRALARSLGIKRETVSPRHSICIGFDLEAPGAAEFAFPALQYNAERGPDRVGYLSLFRIGSAMRANLFVYHGMDSPVITGFRARPAAALRALLPNLHRLIGDFEITGPVHIRPTDLEAPGRTGLPGIAMAGDACFTPCPATGMGTLKAITDAERLCHVHAPRWLASDEEITSERIGEFDGDPIKTACDAGALAKALWLKQFATGSGARWQAERWARYLSRLGRGWARQLTRSEAA